MDKADLVERIKTVLIEELNLEHVTPASIDPAAALFGEGLGLDSLDALQIAVAIEEKFDVRVPEGDEGRSVLASVNALADFISRSQAG